MKPVYMSSNRECRVTRLELAGSVFKHLGRAVCCLTGRRYGHVSLSGALDFVDNAWLSFRSMFRRGK